MQKVGSSVNHSFPFLVITKKLHTKKTNGKDAMSPTIKMIMKMVASLEDFYQTQQQASITSSKPRTEIQYYQNGTDWLYYSSPKYWLDFETIGNEFQSRFINPVHHWPLIMEAYYFALSPFMKSDVAFNNVSSKMSRSVLKH